MSVTPEDLAAALKEHFMHEGAPGPGWIGVGNLALDWDNWIDNDPERAWPVFLSLLTDNWDEHVLESIAFRLELLLESHWDEFEGRVRHLIGQRNVLGRILPWTALEKDYRPERFITRDELSEAHYNLDVHFWRAMRVKDLAESDPEAGPPLIAELLNRLSDAGLKYDTADWLLRTLLKEQGPAVIGAIEKAVTSSGALRGAMWRLWQAQQSTFEAWAISPAILDRVHRAAGPTTTYTAEPSTLLAPPLPPEMEELVSSWIIYQQSWWAYGHVTKLIEHRPDEAWEVIVALIARESSDDELLGALGAGPLEALLSEHSRAFIDRVEQQAAADPKFRIALRNVWRGSVPADEWDRIQRAAAESNE